mgnify:CR=1 FL=1
MKNQTFSETVSTDNLSQSKDISFVKSSQISGNQKIKQD